MLDRIDRDDVLLMDRFFSGYELMETLLYSGKNFIVRARDEMSQNLIKKFKIKNGDGLVELENRCDKNKRISTEKDLCFYKFK